MRSRIKLADIYKVKRKFQKIDILVEAKTPEARKAHKQMSTHSYGRTKINTTGFYERTGKHPVRCKARCK